MPFSTQKSKSCAQFNEKLQTNHFSHSFELFSFIGARMQVHFRTLGRSHSLLRRLGNIDIAQRSLLLWWLLELWQICGHFLSEVLHHRLRHLNKTIKAWRRHHIADCPVRVGVGDRRHSVHTNRHTRRRLERLLRLAGAHSQSAPTKIRFTSERVPYTLFIGGSTFTPPPFDDPNPISRSSIGKQTTRLEQHNTRTHHVRSVSFFTAAGKPYHEPMVVCGVNMSITEGDTRTGDRDASSSKEASSLAAALPAPFFRRLIPDSVDGESDDGALFSTIASTLRSTLPLSDDVVYVRAGARALAETNPPVCVVAIHTVNHPQRRELFELARQHLAAARGEGGANEGIALHGTSLGAVAPICKRGFVVRERNHTQFGVGVYFSPVPRPFEPLEEDAARGGGGESKTATTGKSKTAGASAAADDREDYTTGPCHAPMALDPLYSSPDKTGLQHILLCRVLRGTIEKLRNGGGRGNPQFQPSSDAFDSGVDVDPLNDLDNARRLVVWGANLSTHVRPIAVISVRVLDPRAHCLEECVDGTDPIPCD